MPMLLDHTRKYFVNRCMGDISLTIDVLLFIVTSVSWSITLILRLSPYHIYYEYSIDASSIKGLTLEAVMSGPGKVPPARTVLVMRKCKHCTPPADSEGAHSRVKPSGDMAALTMLRSVTGPMAKA